MGQTAIQSDGLAASSITRSKLNTTLAGNAVIAKLLAGTGITLAQTGVDAGTGDVTPAIDQTFAPTWTGLHKFTPTAGAGVPMTVNGDGTHDIADFVGASGAVQVSSTGNLLNFSRNGFNYITANGGAATLYIQARSTTIITAALGVQIGAAPTGGDKGAGTINVAGGYYLNGVNQFQSGTFTGTLTGMTGTTTGTVSYTIAGNLCTLSFGSIGGTSNTTAMTMTGLPSACQPATQSANLWTFVIDNSIGQLGFAQIAAASGTLTIYKAGISGSMTEAAAFTASGAKGIGPGSLTYSLQ